MSVYTTVDEKDLTTLLQRFTVGELVSLQGVPDGIENTTYFVNTKKGGEVFEWVLTIFESLQAPTLKQYTQLLAFLAQSGIPVANPVCDATGQSVHTLYGKSAVIAPKLAGKHIFSPNTVQCEQVATVLAKLHTETTGYPHPIPAACDFSWIEPEVLSWIDHLSDKNRALMDQALEITRAGLKQFQSLPRAVIHGDLFIDNTLFEGDTLTGVIDFNFAGEDYAVMDICVALNDWCVENDGVFDPERYKRFLQAYQTVRPLQPAEMEAIPFFLHLAALRYWTLRLSVKMKNQSLGRGGDLVKEKDPQWFYDMVSLRQQSLR